MLDSGLDYLQNNTPTTYTQVYWPLLCYIWRRCFIHIFRNIHVQIEAVAFIENIYLPLDYFAFRFAKSSRNVEDNSVTKSGTTGS